MTEERRPAVAGEFYAGTESELREQLAECFEHDLGPGPVDSAEQTAPADVTLTVSPHAGFPFSGPVAANGYAALGATDPSAVIVLGPNHRGMGADAAVAPHDRWRTPIGAVEIDDGLAEAIVDDSALATFDESTHAGEHAIEVQLPFLQYCLEDVSIVPICLTRLGYDRARQLGETLANVVEDAEEVAIVSSTDLTHYETHDVAVDADERVRDAIEAVDTGEIASAMDSGHSMCGPWSTVAGLTATSALGGEQGRILQYATSGQTGGNRGRVVGYCSAVVPG
jgi:AmmeMemoRadiSam system protein B